MMYEVRYLEASPVYRKLSGKTQNCQTDEEFKRLVELDKAAKIVIMTVNGVAYHGREQKEEQ